MYYISMTGVGHLITGVSLSVAAANALNIESIEKFTVFVGVGALASLLPDIDAEQSVIKIAIQGNNRSKIVDTVFSYKERKTLLGGILYALFSTAEIAIRALLTTLMTVINRTFGHRGPTHYLSTSLGLSIILALSLYFLGLDTSYALAFFLGYTIHILGDAATTTGLAFLRPYNKNTLHILPWRFRIQMGQRISPKEMLYVLVFGGLCLGTLLF